MTKNGCATFQGVKDPYTSGQELKVIAGRKVVFRKVHTELRRNREHQ